MTSGFPEKSVLRSPFLIPFQGTREMGISFFTNHMVKTEISASEWKNHVHMQRVFETNSL